MHTFCKIVRQVSLTVNVLLREAYQYQHSEMQARNENLKPMVKSNICNKIRTAMDHLTSDSGPDLGMMGMSVHEKAEIRCPN